MKDVIIASACYEKTYKQVLTTNYGLLHFHVNSNGDDDFDRMIIINDVDDREKVTCLLEQFISKINGTYCYSDDTSKQVVEFWFKKPFDINFFTFRQSYFDLIKYKLKRNKRSGKRILNGYHYSIAALTALYFCKNKYLLWIEDDVYFNKDDDFSWIKKSIDFLEKNEDVITTTCVWNNSFTEAEAEALEIRDDFFISDGFSMQCFFINAEKLRLLSGNQFFSEWNKLVERTYPRYGGRCFEATFNAYMRNHGLKRGIYRFNSYYHKDINKESIDLYESILS